MALGEPVADNAWTVRIQVKPFMTWIWTGCILMALGGLLAAGDGRYRRAREAQARKDAHAALPETAGAAREGY